MTREIKFRAWNKKKQMIDVDSLTIYEDLDANGYYNIYEVLNNKAWNLMQYTGLKDKNGKEIYEGDIIIKNKNFRFEVVWASKWAKFILLSTFLSEHKKHVYMSIQQVPKMKVIGNIYENPELI